MCGNELGFRDPSIAGNIEAEGCPARNASIPRVERIVGVHDDKGQGPGRGKKDLRLIEGGRLLTRRRTLIREASREVLRGEGRVDRWGRQLRDCERRDHRRSFGRRVRETPRGRYHRGTQGSQDLSEVVHSHERGLTDRALSCAPPW